MRITSRRPFLTRRGCGKVPGPPIPPVVGLREAFRVSALRGPLVTTPAATLGMTPENVDEITDELMTRYL